MQENTLRKIEKIHDQAQTTMLSAASFRLLEGAARLRDLRAVFGKSAVRRMLHDINHVRDQAALSWFVTGRALNNPPSPEEIWIFSGRNPEDLYHRRLRTVFPGLTAAELRDVRQSLEGSGFAFKGNSIQSYRPKH